MRLLVLIPHWPLPSELWLSRMLDGLMDCTCAIATYSPPHPRWRDEVPVYDLTPKWMKKIGSVPPKKWIPGLGNTELQKIIERHRADVVLCHYLNFALCFDRLWRALNLNLWIHCHGYDMTWDLRFKGFKFIRRFGRNYKQKCIGLGHRSNIFVNSEFAYRRLATAGFPRDRIHLKYIGVPVSASEPKFSRGGEEQSVLYLGRLADCKGPEKTIRAFDLACSRGFKGTLRLAGDGPMRNECEQHLSRAQFPERISILGAVNEKEGEQLRLGSHVFTAHNCFGQQTGQEESYGVAFVEAMAAGLPIVTGRSGGVLETVIDGETGILFEPNDLGAHADALLRLNNDEVLRVEMAKNSWAHVKRKFSIETELSELRRCLQMVGP